MEIRTESPPLSRHQNEPVPPMFFSDLGVLPNLLSGAGRERAQRKKRATEYRGGRGGVEQKKMKGKRMTNEQGKEAASMGLIQKHSDPVFIVL